MQANFQQETSNFSSPRTAQRWLLDQEEINNLSEKEKLSYKLTSFNEQVEVFLSRAQKNNQFDHFDAKKNQPQDANYNAPHLRVGLGVIRPVVLTMGDCFRTEVAANLCDKKEEIAWNREYRIFNVEFEGAELSIVSHGIGGPGAAICFEELIKLGATTIIRLGTCGSLKPDDIKQGELVVSTACCKEDGHSQTIVPKGFPAVADTKLTLALYEQAKNLGAKVHLGITLTSANFYSSPTVTSSLQVNADSGAISVEMENSTLFCIGTLRGIRTAAIATIDGSPFRWEAGDYDPHGLVVAEAKNKMMLTGLKVAKKLINETKLSRQEAVPSQGQLIEFVGQKLFNNSLTQEYLSIFYNKNFFDYVLSDLNSTTTREQKARLFKLTQQGSFTKFNFYVLNSGIQLSQEQLINLIILFNKVQREQDSNFQYLSSQFITKLENENEGPNE